VGLHRRPLGVQDAVDAGVTQGARSIWVGVNLMVVQYTVQLGTQALNGASALLVEEMRSKFNGIAMELFKGVSQQHAFAFGVDQGTLHIATIPSRTNFHAHVASVDVHVSGHAHRFAIDQNAEWQHTALLMQVQTSRNLLAEGLSDAVGFVGGALLGFWAGRLLGWNIFAAGYGNDSIGGIVLVGLGGGLGLQLARRWQAHQAAAKSDEPNDASGNGSSKDK
jgi:hypothetical protein